MLVCYSKHLIGQGEPYKTRFAQNNCYKIWALPSHHETRGDSHDKRFDTKK